MPNDDPLNPPVAMPPNPWPSLLFCMTFPTLMSWVETRWILPTPPEERSFFANCFFGVTKVIQFGFPVIYVAFAEPRRLRISRPSARGLVITSVFGLIVSAALFLLYFGYLRQSSMLGQTPAKIRLWLDKAHLNSTAGFLAAAVGFSVIHSFLEEYYWRWFVFGWLRRKLNMPAAALLSSLAFTGHHVLVLAYYLPERFWNGVMPLALCITVGGIAWAWLYQRYKNLYAPWLSHLMIDAAIMVVGWDLMQKG